MSSFRTQATAISLSLGLLSAGCGGPAGTGENPFLAEQVEEADKADTAYLNPDGVEVEVDLEGDAEGPSFQLAEAPAMLGQFALSYFRDRKQFYLESLAEDATSDERVEWQVDGAWLSAAEAKALGPAKLKHFRLRGVNAVLLNEARDGVEVGTRFVAKVPKRPYAVMAEAGDTCANPNGHISLGQSVYWYLWNPEKEGCKAGLADLAVTVSKMLPKRAASYPEYDKLVADGKITTVVLFGQIGDGAIDDNDVGMWGFRRMEASLKGAGFVEEPTEVGKRLSKTVKGVKVEMDLYSPREFSGLSDFAHFGNFQRAIAEHEIVVYDGHSMLGASDYWARPKYPDFYQVFLYGGCLGYEYYVRPILAGKQGWQNVDIVSSVVEVSAGANEFAAPWLARMMWGLENGYRTSWASLLQEIRRSVGDSTFGVSGARDNCFTPRGNRCTR